GTPIRLEHQTVGTIHGRGPHRPAGGDGPVVGVDVPGVAAGELPQVEDGALFDVGEQEHHPGTAPATTSAKRRCIRGAAGREVAVAGGGVVVQGDADLMQVVLAGTACGSLADLLDGRHQQADQDGDDGDDDQKLNQREGCSASVSERVVHGNLLRRETY